MRNWLVAGEQVIVASRPQAKSLVWPAIFVVLLPTVLGLVSAWLTRARWPLPWENWRVPALALILCLGVLFIVLGAGRRYLRWLSTRYLLTSRRIVVRTGWLRTRHHDLPLSSVRSVSVRQSMLQRLLRSGDLLVASGFEGTARIPDVPEVTVFRNLLVNAMEALPVAERPRDYQAMGLTGKGADTDVY